MPFPRALLAAVLSASLFVVGCNTSKAASPTGGENLTKIRVGYIGITCEAPIFCAVENGFFKEEGLDVQLIKCEWSKYKDVLALGGFDITHHLIMYLLKPIERGMKTAGMPDPTTDVADLAKKAFVHLDGVSDEWLQSLQVDKIAGGQVPANEEFRLKVELGANRGILKLASCCSPGEK